MYDYNVSVGVSHDEGIDYLTFVVALANSVVEATQRAVTMVMKSQNCPENAIISVVVTLKD